MGACLLEKNEVVSRITEQLSRVQKVESPTNELIVYLSQILYVSLATPSESDDVSATHLHYLSTVGVRSAACLLCDVMMDLGGLSNYEYL